MEKREGSCFCACAMLIAMIALALKMIHKEIYRQQIHIGTSFNRIDNSVRRSIKANKKHSTANSKSVPYQPTTVRVHTKTKKSFKKIQHEIRCIRNFVLPLHFHCHFGENHQLGKC